jgi:hypothetical protein
MRRQCQAGTLQSYSKNPSSDECNDLIAVLAAIFSGLSHATTLMGASSFFIAPHQLGRGQLRPALHNRMEFPQRFPITRFQNVRGELIQHRRHRA